MSISHPSMSSSVRVVVVGDDWVVGRAVQRTLESAGYTVSDVVVCSDRALATAVGVRGAAGIDGGPHDDHAGAAPALGCEAAGNGGLGSTGALDRVRSSARRPVPAPDAQPAGYVITPIRHEHLLRVVATGAEPDGQGPPPVAALPAPAPAVGRTAAAEGGPSRRPHDAAEAVVRRARLFGEGKPLTAREMDVVRLLLSNGRVGSIAEQLAISRHTVRNHLRAVFRKLGVHSQVELIRALSDHRSG